MGEVGIGFTPSAFGNVFQREILEGCANSRRGKPAKLQELARLLLAQPDHRGVAAVLRRVAALAENDADFSDVTLDCSKEFLGRHAARRFRDRRGRTRGDHESAQLRAPEATREGDQHRP